MRKYKPQENRVIVLVELQKTTAAGWVQTQVQDSKQQVVRGEIVAVGPAGYFDNGTPRVLNSDVVVGAKVTFSRYGATVLEETEASQLCSVEIPTILAVEEEVA